MKPEIQYLGQDESLDLVCKVRKGQKGIDLIVRHSKSLQPWIGAEH